MATHLVTGYAGVEHVAAADDATLHAGIVGKEKYVFDSGNIFAYEIVSNNQINIKDGDLMNQGRHIKIAVNDYEELPIDNGLAGVKRYDLICVRYIKDADTNIESASLVVVKGTSSESPTDPEYISGDIFGGDLVDDFPLYRVRLDGLNIEGVDCLFEVIPSIEVLSTKLAEVAKQATANEEAIKANEEEIAGHKTEIETLKNRYVSYQLNGNETKTFTIPPARAYILTVGTWNFLGMYIVSFGGTPKEIYRALNYPQVEVSVSNETLTLKNTSTVPQPIYMSII